MSITYTYNIINTNITGKTMEIIYESPGRATMHISARLPYVGESLESVVRMYAPVNYWLEQERPVEIPSLSSGTITPVTQNTIPTSVTMRQARLALLAINKYSQVQTIIDSLPEPTRSAANIEWEYGITVDRDNGLVPLIAPALGLTELDLDNLFIQASQL